MFLADIRRMGRRCLVLSILCVLPALSSAGPARAEVSAAAAADEPPSLQCRRAIRAAERASAVPEHLLAAIARVESGRRDPRTGDLDPWPWTIDAEGQGAVYDSKAAAIAAVRALQARGVRSIDVGCLQVNLNQHPDAFASLDQAFDPRANADYAARFLSQLFDRTGAWPKAAASYHSATPDVGAAYQALVLAAWPAEKLAQSAALGANATTTPAAAGATAPGGRVAVFLPPNRSDAPRVIPLAAAAFAEPGGPAQGRGLDAYRAAPVALAVRAARAGG